VHHVAQLANGEDRKLRRIVGTSVERSRDLRLDKFRDGLENDGTAQPGQTSTMNVRFSVGIDLGTSNSAISATTAFTAFPLN
jgi:hypothetical protein